jgi:hypothetical protein
MKMKMKLHKRKNQMNKKHTMLYKTLNRALSMMRPHNTMSVLVFTEWLRDRLPEQLYDDAWLDVAGNLHVDNRTHNEHKTLFVSHVDTVHRKTGANKIRKTKTMWYADGAALGADDGVGCALLMHLLHAGVPGYYVFTQGEEVGGIGAKHLAREYPQLLAEFDRAIAFDRRGTDSIISHQGWGRCCSDAFAQGLADALNAGCDEFMYSPDDTGVYTDTAEFVDIIPECTNISCGYDYEHSDREQLDIDHFDRLAAAVIAIDWDGLPTERDPLVVEPDRIEDYSWWKTAPHIPKGTETMFDEDKLDTLDDDEYLLECLLDAEQGFKTNLVELIAESVYPEDKDLAIKLIDRKRITDDAISAAMDMVGKYDVDSVLATLFDAAYAE